MNLKEELMQALKKAMQEKDVLKKETITMLRAAILQVEKDTQKELNEAEMQIIVAKEVKKRKESLPDFEKGGRQDIVDQINKEIQILSEYLPEQLTEEEITNMVLQAISQTGACGMKDMGKVMGAVIAKTKGRADGKIINVIVKSCLNA